MEKNIEVVKQEAGKIEVWANGLVVTNKEEYALAYEGIKQIKTLKTQWLNYWKPVKDNAYKAWKGITGKEKEGADILDNAERTAKQKAESWRQEQERRAEQERLRLQAIADEKARRERERLEKEAEKLKTPELKQERLEQAAMVEAPVISTAPVAEVAGVAIREVWKARVTDINALIASASPNSIASSFLQFNEQAANSFARTTKGKVKVDGIEFYTERVSSVRK
jgi:hypothetical protein